MKRIFISIIAMFLVGVFFGCSGMSSNDTASIEEIPPVDTPPAAKLTPTERENTTGPEIATESPSPEEESTAALRALPPLEEIVQWQKDMGWNENRGAFISYLEDCQDDFSYTIIHHDGKFGWRSTFLAPDEQKYSSVTKIEHEIRWASNKSYSLKFFNTDNIAFFEEYYGEHMTQDEDSILPAKEYVRDVITVILMFSEQNSEKESVAAKVDEILLELEKSDYKDDIVYENDVYRYTFKSDEELSCISRIEIEYKYNWLPNDFDIADYPPLEAGSDMESESGEALKYCVQGIVESVEGRGLDVHLGVKTSDGGEYTLSMQYDKNYVEHGGGIPFMCEEGQEYIFYVECFSKNLIIVDVLELVQFK